jgi:hypothetical protein
VSTLRLLVMSLYNDFFISTSDKLWFGKGRGWFVKHNKYSSTSGRRNPTAKWSCLNICYVSCTGVNRTPPKRVLLYVCVTWYLSPCLCCVSTPCVCVYLIYGDRMCDTVPHLCMACFSDHEPTGLFFSRVCVENVLEWSVRQPFFTPLFSGVCTSCSKRY